MKSLLPLILITLAGCSNSYQPVANSNSPELAAAIAALAALNTKKETECDNKCKEEIRLITQSIEKYKNK